MSDELNDNESRILALESQRDDLIDEVKELKDAIAELEGDFKEARSHMDDIMMNCVALRGFLHDCYQKI